ncbi:MAG: hypothetical protein WA862_09900 [Solirubrobacterales bacterium]
MAVDLDPHLLQLRRGCPEGVAMWPAMKTAIGAVPVRGSLKGWIWDCTVIRGSPCCSSPAA